VRVNDHQGSLADSFNQIDIGSIQTEIDGSTSFKKLFAQPELIKIITVSQNERYGSLAGLYTKDQIGGSFIEGYFGAFKVDSEMLTIPLKGLLVVQGKVANSFSANYRSSSSAEIEELRTVSIDISGNNWKGEYWTSDDYEGTVTPVSASITQDSSDNVTISTDLIGIGGYLVGDIYEDGHMMLYDQYDDEDWTTYSGPASELSVIIADFVRPPTLEEPSPPLNIIALTRLSKSPMPVGAINLLLK